MWQCKPMSLLPDSDRNFPDFFEAYLDFTENHESTKRVKLWSAISIVAAALERKVFLNRGYYTLFPNLYIFIIGRSGLIKKSTSTAIAVSLFRELEKINIMSERLTASSLIQQMMQSGSAYDLNGVKTKQSAVYAYASELAVFLVEVFGSISEVLTTLYDCIPHDSKKPWVYHTMGRGETKIYGPCLNILGASTKAWLKRCIPVSEIEGGFASRIMFVVEDNLPDKLIAWPDVDAHLNIQRLKLVEDLRQIHEIVGEFKVEERARNFFTEWYLDHMKVKLPKQVDPRVAGYLARKGDHILKLGMVRAVSLSNQPVLKMSHLEWGLKRLDELEEDWKSAFDGKFMTADEGQCRYEMQALVKQMTRIKKAELLRLYIGRFNDEHISKSLRDLIKMGEVEVLRMAPDGLPEDQYVIYTGDGL